jgi:DNA-binding transcriptional regulator YiaG
MTNFAQQLKAEISRLAKKQIRGEVQTLKKASAQYRADIVVLKRRIADLENAIKHLSKGKPSNVVQQEIRTDSQVLRFRVDGFAALRKKLGLSAADMGKLLGVSAQSVYHWETGKTKPRASQLQAISAVRKMGKRAVAIRLAD